MAYPAANFLVSEQLLINVRFCLFQNSADKIRSNFLIDYNFYYTKVFQLFLPCAKYKCVFVRCVFGNCTCSFAKKKNSDNGIEPSLKSLRFACIYIGAYWHKIYAKCANTFAKLRNCQVSHAVLLKYCFFCLFVCFVFLLVSK